MLRLMQPWLIQRSANVDLSNSKVRLLCPDVCVCVCRACTQRFSVSAFAQARDKHVCVHVTLTDFAGPHADNGKASGAEVSFERGFCSDLHTRCLCALLPSTAFSLVGLDCLVSLGLFICVKPDGLYTS